MRLYVLYKCPYGHRAAIVLAEKKLEHEIVFFEPGKRPPELAALGERAKSPTLFDGDTKVYDSSVVLEYLEDRYPDPSLLPRDAAARAEVRMLIARYNDEVGTKYNTLVMSIYGGKADSQRLASEREAFSNSLTAWDGYFKGRTFAVGDALTLADITLYTLFPSVQSYANVEVPTQLVHLHAWLERMRARPSTKLPAPPTA